MELQKISIGMQWVLKGIAWKQYIITWQRGRFFLSRFYPLDDVATVACCLSSDQMQLARNAKASINNVTMRTVPFVTRDNENRPLCHLLWTIIILGIILHCCLMIPEKKDPAKYLAWLNPSFSLVGFFHSPHADFLLPYMPWDCKTFFHRKATRAGIHVSTGGFSWK